ncbi:hypothetical protein MC885_020232 [Smutsia gigantea]|nr:hypothetical protein MC885_020232 [Smutsia gigantea]
MTLLEKVSEVRADVLLLAQGKEGAEPQLVSRAQHEPNGPQPPRCPRGWLPIRGTTAPERRASPTPAPAAAANNPTINKRAGLGVRVPERTGWGQLLAQRAPPAAPIRGCRESRAQGRRRGEGGRNGGRHGAVRSKEWQQTVHRYLSVRHSKMIKRPPKKVTMEEARNAHHMRWPRLSHGTSMVTGMMSASILGSWTEDEEEEEEEEEEEDASRLRWFAWILLLILSLLPPPPPPPPPPPFAIASNGRPAQRLGGAPPAASATPNTHQQPYCCYRRRRGARGGGEAPGLGALCATWRGARRYIQRAAARPPPGRRPARLGGGMGLERAGAPLPGPHPARPGLRWPREPRDRERRWLPAPGFCAGPWARPGSARGPGCPRRAARRAPRVCAALWPDPSSRAARAANEPLFAC